MKTFLLTLISFFFLTTGYCQNIELSVFGNASFFSYVGNTNPTTIPFYGGGPPYNYSNGLGTEVWGGNLASGYSVGVQAQYVAKSDFITGLQVGYESLRSDQHLVDNNAGNSIVGQFYFQSNYLTLNPYLGYRFNTRFLKIDLMPGMDIAIDGNAHGYGNAFYEGHAYTISEPYGSIKTDFRARLGATAWYKRIGVAASYSRGLTNFQPGTGGLTPDSHPTSQVIRLGLIFRVL